MDAVPWLYYQSARDRRWLSLALAMLLAMLAQTGAMWLQDTWPGPDPRAWALAYGDACTFALVTSQGLHGQRLSKTPRKMPRQNAPQP
jgi:hypothetical protein